MFISADTVPKNSEIKSDICIVGAGAAGIALALEFADSQKDILFLESGGLEKTPEAQTLNETENTNLEIALDSRVRQFGGTTTVWMGLWKPHDPIDLEKREWVPNSGWPISYEILQPYYERAEKRFEAPDLSSFTNSLPPGPFNNEVLEPTVIGKIKREDWDFGKKYRYIFENSKNIKVCLNANAVELEANEQASKLERIKVKTISRNEFRIKAQNFILASGGIENARLLLLSTSINKAGLGNDNNQVGRCFMEHPKGVAGKIKLRSSLSWPYTTVGVRLTPEAQKKYHVLNSYVMPEPLNVSFWNKLSKKMLDTPSTTKEIVLRNFMEQFPSPNNRIYLSDKLDRLGCRKVKIDWKINELDKHTMVVLHKLIAEELKNQNIGDLESPILQGADSWPITKDASHHMGTTRMGYHPKTSVVNANCRLHRIENLYVAGSSVFPTGGHANPTATIIALAIRLADHLKSL